MAKDIEGPAENPPSSFDVAGMVAGVAELDALRAVLRANGELSVGNPKGLTVNRLIENGANGLNTRGRALADPGEPPDCAAALSITAKLRKHPAANARHLNIDGYSQSILTPHARLPSGIVGRPKEAIS
jgi:hypothetical protein